jgi:tetratricopeptide (TPR) repeat protein
MNALGRSLLSFLLTASLASPVAAASNAPEPDDFGDAPVAGAFAGFGLLRLGGGEAAPPLDGRLLTSSDAVLRFLVDSERGSAFGYRLRVTATSTTPAEIFRLEIQPLTRDDERELKRLTTCEGCPALRLMSSTPTRFPPPRIIRNSDVVVIDLLVRPDTGEKIVDVVRFSPRPVTRDTLDVARSRVAQAFSSVKRGDELLAHGAVEEAAAEYVKAAALQSDAAIHLRLGQCYEKLDRLEQAQQEYERSVRLNAGDADVWFRLGVVRHRLGRFGKAANSYEHAIKLRPDWPLARRNLGTAHVDRADIERASREYRAAYHANHAILREDTAFCVRAHDAALEQYVFAKVYAAEGELGPALASLKKARDIGFRDLDRVRDDDEFKPFLTDPRLVSLIEDTSHLSSAKP